MQITQDNVGDIIQMSHDAKCIQIESVTDQLVKYRRESGHCYATFAHEVEGSVVQDQRRAVEFARNFAIGAALLRAEYNAICKGLSMDCSPEQRAEASSVLQSVRGMQDHLISRISQRESREVGKTQGRGSLEHMISKANSETVSQSHSSFSSPVSVHDR